MRATAAESELAPGDRGTGEPRVAVLVPCLDEAQTIAKVIDDFRRVLPTATVWVIDNGSADDTAGIAAAHGARVLIEARRGKGYAMRAAFRRVDADIYLMVDGDDTYPAEAAVALIEPVRAGQADMTVGSRRMAGTTSQFRPLNRLGNWLYPALLRFLLRVRLTDILSGYRAMSRSFVRGVPIAASGFEIEAELTVKALERSYRVLEVPIDLRSRPEGSHSKIRIASDGWRILWTIVVLFRDYRPMAFFGTIGLALMAVGLVLGYSVIVEFLQTHLVPRLPTAILAAALELAGMLLITVGFVLSAVSRRFQELESKLDMFDSRPARPEAGLPARTAAASADLDDPDAGTFVDEQRHDRDAVRRRRTRDLEGRPPAG